MFSQNSFLISLSGANLSHFFISSKYAIFTSLKVHILIRGLKFKILLRENILYDYELQAATLYDYFAPVIFGIQVVPVMSPPPHLVYLRRLYMVMINSLTIHLKNSKPKFQSLHRWHCRNEETGKKYKKVGHTCMVPFMHIEWGL